MTTYLKAAREIDNGCVKIIIEREGQDIELRSNEWTEETIDQYRYPSLWCGGSKLYCSGG